MLTDTEIKGLKPKAKPHKVSDSGGLHLLIMPPTDKLPKGSKLWKLAYRFAGRQKTLSFGSYPSVGLADARGRRELAKAQLRQGEDPGHIVKVEKQAAITATGNIFSAVGEEWKQRKIIKEKKSESTIARTDWLLRMLNADIGDRPINEVTAPELLKVLRKAEAQGLHEKVARLRSAASRIFRYGIATGKCERDVAIDLRGATTTATSTSHAAVTDPADVGALMRKIDTLDGGRHPRLMRLALRMLAYTFVRPGELRLAEWSEIDSAAAVWVIPASKAKMKRLHRVPLSKQAITVLNEVREITGAGQYVFTSTVKPKQPLHKNSFNDALRRLGYGHDDMVSHGFRALASTSLNEMNQWPVDVIERQLAHQERNKVRRAYNRAEYWPERVAMMQAWADRLDELRGRGKVVALPKRRKRGTS
jgi:integrase